MELSTEGVHWILKCNETKIGSIIFSRQSMSKSRSLSILLYDEYDKDSKVFGESFQLYKNTSARLHHDWTNPLARVVHLE